jgi:autotransporter-associated beta strand protein
LNAAGPGQVILAGASIYTGNTIVSGGTLSLSSGASIADSPNLILAGGAIFDVSQLSSPLTLGSGQTLSNNTSTAVLSGSLHTGSGTVSLTYSAGTPSFTIVTNGILTLSSSTVFKINNSGPALALGSYLIISTNGTDNSIVAGTAPSSVIVSGGGIAAGLAPSLSISNNELYLGIGTPTVNPNPTNIVFSVTNNQLILSWPADHIGWQLQAQTNSLSVGLSTNWANVSGSTSTNQIAVPINLANGSVFYRLTY